MTCSERTTQMSQVIRKASPAAKAWWWICTLFTGGLYALFRGYPK